LAIGAWELGGSRPANHPARRIRGLAALAAWLVSAPETVVDLVRADVTRAKPAFWRWAAIKPWVGEGRALAIAANVLLPFAQASGVLEGEALFRGLAGEPHSRPTLHMQETLGLRLRKPTACQQQGLLELYKSACVDRACGGCLAAQLTRGLAEERAAYAA
jgi:hypothetical protein